MSTRTVPIDYTPTPSQAMTADQIGNEVYSSHYAERKAYRLILGCGTVLLCGSMWLNFSLAHRPVTNRASASTRWAAPKQSSTPT